MLSSASRSRRAGPWIVAPALLALTLRWPAPALAEPGVASRPASSPSIVEADQALQKAETSIEAGQFARAAELVATVGPEHPRAARARFIEGYARYKLGQLETALKLLERSLSLEHSLEVTFLAGLCSFELRRWAAVERYLAPLVSAGKAPWAEPSRTLLDRARRQSLLQREQEAKALHAESILLAKRMLEANRYPEAAQALQQAERASPGHLLNRYYRGYLAYQRGDYQSARDLFRAVLRVDPRDSWSRYMLALSLEENTPEKKRLLTELSRGTEPTLRVAARQALAAETSSAAGGGLSLLLEFGIGLDTNPGQVTGALGSPPQMDRAFPLRPAPPGEADTGARERLALPLLGRVDLSYQRQLAPGHRGTIGVRLLEQGFAVGGTGLEQTEIDASLRYALQTRRLELGASYEYTLDLLGHSPLLSLHDFGLTLAVPLRSWLSCMAGAGLRWRDIHDESYDYMQALESSGSLSLRGQWRRGILQIGYHLVRSWASPVETLLALQPGGSLDTVYRTNYSYLGHGPHLDLELSLFWRLSLRGGAWLLWHSFDDADSFRMQPVGEVIWQQARRDLKIVAALELRRPLTYGLELALLFSSVDNLSSLDDTTPVNRTYDRRSLLLSVRWRWPLP